RSMPSVEAETPRKMFPPPMTMPTSTPISMTSRTSCAICWRMRGEMPYLLSPISASPLNLRRMRLNRGGLEVGAGTGGGSYLASVERSRSAFGHGRGLDIKHQSEDEPEDDASTNPGTSASTPLV